MMFMASEDGGRLCEEGLDADLCIGAAADRQRGSRIGLGRVLLIEDESLGQRGGAWRYLAEPGCPRPQLAGEVSRLADGIGDAPLQGGGRIDLARQQHGLQ